MILIRSDDDAATTAAIERALKGQEVDIFQSDDETYTTEELLKMLAYNAKQTRIYVGRLERNTRRLEEDVRSVSRLLEPLATYMTYLLAETGDDPVLLEQLRKNRERQKAMEEAKNPVMLGQKAERLTNEGS